MKKKFKVTEWGVVTELRVDDSIATGKTCSGGWRLFGPGHKILKSHCPWRLGLIWFSGQNSLSRQWTKNCFMRYLMLLPMHMALHYIFVHCLNKLFCSENQIRPSHHGQWDFKISCPGPNRCQPPLQVLPVAIMNHPKFKVQTKHVQNDEII